MSLSLVQTVLKKAKVTLVLRKGVGDFVRNIEGVTVIEVDKGSSKSYAEALKLLSEKRFDIAIALHSSFRSALFISRIKASIKIGYQSKWTKNWAFDILIQKQLGWPEPMRALQVITPLVTLFSSEVAELQNNDYSYLNQSDSLGRLPPVPEMFRFPSRPEFEVRLKRVAFFHGSQWGTKKWPLKHFIELQQWFQELGYEVYWLGTEAEGTEIRQALPGLSEKSILAGKLKVNESVEFLMTCQLAVSNDSGGGHLAAWAGCKVATFFGPTSLKFGYRPWANSSLVLELLGLNCRPCHHHGPPKCPLGHHRCMIDLQVATVTKSLANFI